MKDIKKILSDINTVKILLTAAAETGKANRLGNVNERYYPEKKQLFADLQEFKDHKNAVYCFKSYHDDTIRVSTNHRVTRMFGIDALFIYRNIDGVIKEYSVILYNKGNIKVIFTNFSDEEQSELEELYKSHHSDFEMMINDMRTSLKIIKAMKDAKIWS